MASSGRTVASGGRARRRLRLGGGFGFRVGLGVGAGLAGGRRDLHDESVLGGDLHDVLAAVLRLVDDVGGSGFGADATLEGHVMDVREEVVHGHGRFLRARHRVEVHLGVEKIFGTQLHVARVAVGFGGVDDGADCGADGGGRRGRHHQRRR